GGGGREGGIVDVLEHAGRVEAGRVDRRVQRRGAVGDVRRWLAGDGRWPRRHDCPEDLHPAAVRRVGGDIDVAGRAGDVHAAGARERAELADHDAGRIVLDDRRVVDDVHVVADEVDADPPGALAVDDAQIGPGRVQLVERLVPLHRPDRAVGINGDVAQAETHVEGREV